MTQSQLLFTSFIVTTFFYNCASPIANENRVEKGEDTVTKTTHQFDYAYEKDGKIYAFNERSKSDSFITDGMNPCISPSGQQIAFTEYSDGGDRQVSVIDLLNKEKKRLAVNNTNFYGAIWSPDGKFIAFNYYVYDSASWLIGVVDSENKLFKPLTKINKWGASWYAPTWADDSEKIVTHNLDTIFIYQLDGSLVSIYLIDSITKEHEITSNTRFFLTDNKLVFNGTSGDTVDIEISQDEGQIIPEAIYSYNLQDNKISRITPKGIDCGSFCLRGNSEILFSAFNYKTKTSSAYKINLNGENLKLLIGNGKDITGRQK